VAEGTLHAICFVGLVMTIGIIGMWVLAAYVAASWVSYQTRIKRAQRDELPAELTHNHNFVRKKGAIL